MDNLGKIQSIRECTWVKGECFEGYEVETDKNSIRVLIDNSQQCCENWGYFICNGEATEQYIGKVLTEVRLTDTDCRTKMLEEHGLSTTWTEIQFVDFCFADGDVLQIAVYNEHNGYYGHDILVLVNQDVLKEGCL